MNCSEGDHINDDNPGDSMCKTCRDWVVEEIMPMPDPLVDQVAQAILRGDFHEIDQGLETFQGPVAEFLKELAWELADGR